MKKREKSIDVVLIISILLYCFRSMYDTTSRFAFIASIVWCIAAYNFINELKSSIQDEINYLKENTGISHFIASFFTSGIVIVLYSVLFIFSFSNSFQPHFVAVSSFFESIVSVLGLAFFILTSFLAFTFIFYVPTGAILSSLINYSSQFAAALSMHLMFFLLISGLCGILDLEKIIDIISDIWSLIF